MKLFLTSTHHSWKYSLSYSTKQFLKRIARAGVLLSETFDVYVEPCNSIVWAVSLHQLAPKSGNSFHVFDTTCTIPPVLAGHECPLKHHHIEIAGKRIPQYYNLFQSRDLSGKWLDWYVVAKIPYLLTDPLPGNIILAQLHGFFNHFRRFDYRTFGTLCAFSPQTTGMLVYSTGTFCVFLLIPPKGFFSFYAFIQTISFYVSS